MMEQPLVAVRNLEVAYHTQRGTLQALYDVNLHIMPGEIVGVVGETGCGKSTVASSLLRLLPPNGEILRGQIRFKDQNLLEAGDEQLRRLRGQEMAMIFQDPMTSLNPVFTVGGQMVDIQRAHNDGRRGQRASRGELRQRAIDVLEQVGIPDAGERIDHYPHHFSGGMRQRIMIAMALLSRPDLLVADEATASLDVTLEAQILELIKELRQKYNTAVLFISHDLGVIAQLCDRVIVMYAGHIVEQGDVYRLFEDPQHPYTRALLGSVPTRHQYDQRLTTIPGRVPSLFNLPPGCKFAGRCPHVQTVCRQQEPQLLDNDGHEVRCLIYDSESGYDHSQLAGEVEAGPAATPATPERDLVGQNGHHLIETDRLSMHFIEEPGLLGQLFGAERDSVRAVDDVDLAIARGEVVGLVGESGSGKTTLGRTILRLQEPTAGRIMFDSQDITDATHRELRRLRPRMQMIFQDPYSGLSPRLRVSYLLREPYKIHNVPREDQYSVSELLRFVGLSDEQAHKFPHELSGGQARRVGIARALALRPDFIVADEPTSGLDVSVAASVLNLMRDLASQFNLTYLIITHNLNVIGYIASRVAVMYLGNLVEIGPTAEIFNNPAHPYSLALLSAISEPDPRQRGRRLLLSGEIPSPKNPPAGCRFHTRCPFVERKCRVEPPPLEQVGPGHWVACHRWDYVREHGTEKD